MKTDSILISSLIFSEPAMLNRSGIGINPAARRWLIGISDGLRKNQKDVYYLGHEITSLFPKGSFSPGNKVDLMYPESSVLAKYLNIWPFRWWSLSFMYKRSYPQVVNSIGKPSYLLSYNPWPNQIALGNFVKHMHSEVNWIMVVLDYDHAEKGFEDLLKKTKKVDYFVFLSQWAYDNFPLKNKFLLEGGVNAHSIDNRYNSYQKNLGITSRKEKFVILYSGMFDKWGGLEKLLQVFTSIHIDSELELWVCGFGNSDYIFKAMDYDDRIKFYGTVSNKKLENLSLKADAFINPRPKNISGNLMNFPSKLLEYLTYCKPVISTYTPGLPGEYKDVIFLIEDTEESIRNAIFDVTQLDYSSQNLLSKKIFEFLRNKTWQNQISRLFDWIEK
jgi:glycosyltransferase involved in cell wall biosynthesis